MKIKYALIICLFLQGCGGGGSSSNKEVPLVTLSNQSPVVNAGDNFTVEKNSTVVLTAQASDSDGSIDSYTWEQISGVEVELLTPNTITTSFKIPNINSNEDLTFEFKATDNDGATSNDTVTISVETILNGGSVSSPASVSFNLNNYISSNISDNYYKFTVKKDEVISIHAELSIPLTDLQISRCPSLGFIENQSNLITIFDDELNIIGGVCGEDLLYRFTEAGTYILQLNYVDIGSDGYFNISSAIDGYFNTSPEESISLPGSIGKPVSLNSSQSAKIYSNRFFNHYSFAGRKGDKLFINANLNGNIEAREYSRCIGNGGSRSKFSFINIYDKNYRKIYGYSCELSTNFTIPKDDTYIIQVHFPSGNSGYSYINTGHLNAETIFTESSLFRDIEIADTNQTIISSDFAVQQGEATISIDSGTLMKNGVDLPDLSTKANIGDIINIKQLSPINLGKTIKTEVSIDSVQESYEITTKVQDYDFIKNFRFEELGSTFKYLSLHDDTIIDFSIVENRSSVTLYDANMSSLHSMQKSQTINIERGDYLIDINNTVVESIVGIYSPLLENADSILNIANNLYEDRGTRYYKFIPNTSNYIKFSVTGEATATLFNNEMLLQGKTHNNTWTNLRCSSEICYVKIDNGYEYGSTTVEITP